VCGAISQVKVSFILHVRQSVTYRIRYAYTQGDSDAILSTLVVFAVLCSKFSLAMRRRKVKCDCANCCAWNFTSGNRPSLRFSVHFFQISHLHQSAKSWKQQEKSTAISFMKIVALNLIGSIWYNTSYLSYRYTSL